MIVVQTQGGNGGSSTGCQTDDLCRIFAPAKMLRPDLSARVEQRCSGTADGINAVSPCALVAVAPCAGKPQVFLVGCSTLRQWNDMFHLHLGAADLLRGQAIAAAVMCCLGYLVAQRFGDVIAAHGTMNRQAEGAHPANSTKLKRVICAT